MTKSHYDTCFTVRINACCQRFANMARSRFLAGYLFITRMFILLLICLDSTKAAMGYYLLLAAAFPFFKLYFS
jgi:hypothetical protein